MGERKVLNRYIPPDFDPSIIPRIKRDKDKLIEVRMMLPFSLRCNTCGEYMYAGKKFNSKSERVKDEDYMGIRKIRFYIKCSVCSAEITFKTDPKNSDYECESGASRNFELWRDTQKTLEEAAAEKEEEEYDAMKKLENRTIDNKVEMDILDALDEIKAINQRHQRVDTQEILSKISKQRESSDVNSSSASIDIINSSGLTQKDEELVKSIQFGKKRGADSLCADSFSTASKSSLVDHLQKEVAQGMSATNRPPVIIKKKKRLEEAKVAEVELKITESVDAAVAAVEAPPPQESSSSLLGLLMSYGDDEDNDG